MYLLPVMVLHRHRCVKNKRRTYRDRDFVDVAKVRGSYEGWGHVLGVNYIDCYGGCGGQHLVPPLVLSTSILRKQVVAQKAKFVL